MTNIGEIFKEKTSDKSYDTKDILDVGAKVKEIYAKDVDALKKDIKSEAGSLTAEILDPIKKANEKEMNKEINSNNLNIIKNRLTIIKSNLKSEYTTNILATNNNIDVATSAFKVIGMTSDAFLAKISDKSLFARGDKKDWETLRNLCKDCTSAEFDNNVLQATLFFQGMVGEYKNGNSAYGVDGVIGKYTLKALHNILSGINKSDIDNQYLTIPNAPSTGEGGRDNKEPVKPATGEAGRDKPETIEAKKIYQDLIKDKVDTKKILDTISDNIVLDEVSLMLRQEILKTKDTKEKKRLEEIGKSVVLRRDEILKAKNNPKEKEKEKEKEIDGGGKDLMKLLGNVTAQYEPMADVNGGATKTGALELLPTKEGDESEYEKRVTLLMLHYFSINGVKLADAKQAIAGFERDIDPKTRKPLDTFSLQMKTKGIKAEGGEESKIVSLHFSAVEKPEFGNRVELKVITKSTEFTAGKFMTYDIYAPDAEEKAVDVKTMYNREKTIDKLKKEMKYNLTKPFEASLTKYPNTKFLKEIKLSEKLEIDKKGPIDDVDLSNPEKYKDIEGYSKKVYINYQGDYREIGKIYFNKDGTLNLAKSKKNDLKIYGIDLEPTLEKGNTDKTVDLNITDAKLKELDDKIKAQKTKITDDVMSQATGAPTDLLTNMQREKLKDVSRIQIYPLRDLYSYNVIDDDGESTAVNTNKTNIYFAFDAKNTIQITNYFGEEISNKTIVGITDKKKGGKSIERNFELKLDGNKLSCTETKNKIASAILPTIKGVTLPENTLYSTKTKSLEYYDTTGTLASSIVCDTPKAGKESMWRLGENKTTVDPLDFFDIAQTDTCDILGDTEKENIFKNLMSNELGNKLTRNSTIRVLEDNNKMIYKYYIIQDNKDNSFTVKEDLEIKEAAKRSLKKMEQDFLIIDKINTINLKLWERVTKKEKDLSLNSGLGGIGICDVTTNQIITFVQSNEKNRTLYTKIGKDESKVNITPDQTMVFIPKDDTVIFDIKSGNIDVKNESTKIANDTYTLDYEKNGNKLLLEKEKKSF